MQMNRHSTLASYLHRLLWMLTGNLGKPGTHYIPTPLVDFTNGALKRKSPVVEAPIIGGLVPCNVIADEILTDHPQALSRDDHRGGQSRPFAGRQPAHAGSDGGAGHASWSSTWP